MAETGISPELQAILDSQAANSESGAEAILGAAGIGAEASLTGQRENRLYATEAAEKAAGIYSRWSKGGWEDKGRRAEALLNQGPPQYAWDKEFTHDPWKWDRKFEHQGWDEYSKDRFTDEGIQKSPYYGLYQYQKEQQDQATNKMLRARGQFGSGAGMKESLNKQSGIDEGFVAGEYNRARGEYATDYDQALSGYTREYNEALQGHNISYEEAKQKYGMSLDQYNKAFGVRQGQYTDKLNTLYGLVDYGWKADVATANAYIGQGTQSGSGAVQSGNSIANLWGSTGQALGQNYNAQGNQLTSIYNTTANNAAAQTLANQGYNYANGVNNGNQTLGYATLGAGLVRTGYDAYRYYNTNNNPTSYYGSNVPSNFYGGGGMPGDTGTGYGDTYTSWD